MVYDCAPDAICSTTVHDIECTCRPGFTGDGRSYCSRGECSINIFSSVAFCGILLHDFYLFFILVPSDLIEPELVAGCDSNRECPDYTACRNSRCINPCAVDDPCAPSASCKVIGHEPVCTCPDGYIGDPRTRCERKILYTKYFLIDD